MQTFDVVVVGAGPGGMAAASVAGEAGARVCLIDDNPSTGGQIWRGFGKSTPPMSKLAVQHSHWKARLEQSRCQVQTSCQVVDFPAEGRMRIVKDGQDSKDIAYQKLILATGARERFLPFPGWTLPGVIGVGGLQAMVKSGLSLKNSRVVVAGSGPLLLAVSAAIESIGANVQGIFEQAPLSQLLRFGVRSLLHNPGKLIEGASYRLNTRHAPYRQGAWIERADGDGRLKSVTIRQGEKRYTMDCDWLACGFHLVPNLELPRLLGCCIDAGYVTVDELQQSAVPNIACIGELTGIGGMDKAILEGQIAGWAAVGASSKARSLASKRRRAADFAVRLDQTFALRPELRRLASSDTIVCRCEDVQYASLAACSSSRAARLHTRCGMGACQGRVCGTAGEFLFGWQASSVRPPAFPVPVSTLATSKDAVPLPL